MLQMIEKEFREGEEIFVGLTPLFSVFVFLSSSSYLPIFSPSQVIEGRVHTEIDASGAAESLRNAEKIVIVPGYGLAVAQAAGVVAEIALKLRKEGKDVKFAVHPVVSQ